MLEGRAPEAENQLWFCCMYVILCSSEDLGSTTPCMCLLDSNQDRKKKGYPTPVNATDARVCAVKDKTRRFRPLQAKKERRTLRPVNWSTVEFDLGSYPTLAAPVDVDMLPVAAAVPDTAVPDTAVPARAAVEVADIVGADAVLEVVVSEGA